MTIANLVLGRRRLTVAIAFAIAFAPVAAPPARHAAATRAVTPPSPREDRSAIDRRYPSAEGASERELLRLATSADPDRLRRQWECQAALIGPRL